MFASLFFPADDRCAQPSRGLCLGSRSSGLDSCRCDHEDEVITRYGQPDWVIASPGGDIAVYRPTTSGPPATRLEIPTAQAGPFGAATTGMQSIDPGLGAKDLNGKAKERLWKEMRIRYDDRGVVQELSSP